MLWHFLKRNLGYILNTSTGISLNCSLAVPCAYSSYSHTGSHCEENINECLHPIDHCYSHGRCVDGIDSFSCICNAGYTGRRCNSEINECKPDNPCQNGGTCLDRVNK